MLIHVWGHKPKSCKLELCYNFGQEGLLLWVCLPPPWADYSADYSAHMSTQQLFNCTNVKCSQGVTEFEIGGSLALFIYQTVWLRHPYIFCSPKWLTWDPVLFCPHLIFVLADPVLINPRSVSWPFCCYQVIADFLTRVFTCDYRNVQFPEWDWEFNFPPQVLSVTANGGMGVEQFGFYPSFPYCFQIQT